MTSQVGDSQKALQDSNRVLETRVADRTRALADTIEALSASETSLREAQRIAHLGHWAWDVGTGQQVWSEEQYRIFGLEPFEMDPSYELFVGFLHPADSARVQATLADAVGGNGDITTEYRIVIGDGSVKWVETQLKAAPRGDGESAEISGTVLDITARKRVERLLMEEKERALVTLHSIGDAVIATDNRGILEYLNPVAERLTGHSLDDVRGQPLKHAFRIINEETREPAVDPVARCLSEGKIVGLANHTLLVSKSGAEYAIQDSAAPIRDPTGAVLGVVLVFSDVTEARRLSRQITYEARHDALTSLLNRREFEKRLGRVVETARADSTESVLCFLDLDQFKLVNDTCGHVAGDEILRQVSALLQDNVRHRDTMARLGGDEFGLLMEHCSLDEARKATRKLIEAVSEHQFVWEDKRFKLGLSIGMVEVVESSPDSDELLMAADSACLMAKEQGRNRVHVFQEDDEELAKRHGEMEWAVRLPRALEEGSFRLYCQPIAPIEDGENEGAHYEVLIRLDDEQIVLPNRFFPAADRYQLSSRLDRWVIASTFQWISQHPEHLQTLHLCSINLSGHSLNEETFLEFINQKFAESPIPPARICFEITETVAVANFSRATNFMNALKQKGCRFALDDFGSGLSSFAYLKTLPVDFLKIDGLFVRDILDDSLDLAFVRSINEIGKLLGMKTIAEFVENEAILSKIAEIGVDYAQGFAVGHPKPIDELVN